MIPARGGKRRWQANNPNAFPAFRVLPAGKAVLRFYLMDRTVAGTAATGGTLRKDGESIFLFLIPNVSDRFFISIFS